MVVGLLKRLYQGRRHMLKWNWLHHGHFAAAFLCLLGCFKRKQHVKKNDNIIIICVAQ